MRLLLDECFDWRLGEDFEGHEVAHVTRIGWAGIKNGRLLALAQTRFDVFVTIDKNLPRQQHLARFDIAVIVVRVRSNRLADCRPAIPEIVAALARAKKGQAIYI